MLKLFFWKIKNSNHFFKNKEKELASEIENILKKKMLLFKLITSPPVIGLSQPVVLGKEIGSFKIDLIARKAKA